jgi:hypothetical protein
MENFQKPRSIPIKYPGMAIHIFLFAVYGALLATFYQVLLRRRTLENRYCLKVISQFSACSCDGAGLSGTYQGTVNGMVGEGQPRGILLLLQAF